MLKLVIQARDERDVPLEAPSGGRRRQVPFVQGADHQLSATAESVVALQRRRLRVGEPYVPAELPGNVLLQRLVEGCDHDRGVCRRDHVPALGAMRPSLLFSGQRIGRRADQFHGRALLIGPAPDREQDIGRDRDVPASRVDGAAGQDRATESLVQAGDQNMITLLSGAEDFHGPLQRKTRLLRHPIPPAHQPM